MRRTHYGLFLIVVFSTLFFSLVKNGDLLLTGFVVDALHSILISMEISKGSVLHSDIHTPLGILAFLPVSKLMDFGFGAGKALAYANALIAFVMLPAIYWVGVSRFDGVVRFLFGGMVLLFSMALLHGGIKTGVDMSMYYNRWCWAVASLIFAIVLLPASNEPTAGRWDGVVLGTSAVFLIFTKMTFAALLGPVVLLALLMRQRWTCLAWTTGTFAVLAAVLLTYLGGIQFGINYVGDLLTVYQSELRSSPSESLTYTAIGPQYFVGTICLFLALLFLRKEGFETEGALMLILAPAVIYIAYQNWGNDAFWTLPVAACLWQLSKGAGGETAKRSMRLAGVSVVMALTFVPVLQSLMLSNLIHVAIENEAFDPVLKDEKDNSFKVLRSRLTKVVVETIQSPTDAEIETASVEFGGVTFADCRLKRGEVGHDLMLARGVDAVAETAGQPVLLADLVQVLPLMSNTTFPKGMSPWYYGGTQGFETSKYLAVPHCASLPAARLEIINALRDNGYVPTLLSNTKDLAVFRITAGI